MDERGNTALYQAVRHLDVTTLLLHCRADVSAVNEKGDTRRRNLIAGM